MRTAGGGPAQASPASTTSWRATESGLKTTNGYTLGLRIQSRRDCPDGIVRAGPQTDSGPESPSFQDLYALGSDVPGSMS